MKKYSISCYNKYACLKANALMLAISLFLLKPYIIAIASITYRKDRNAIIELFYDDKIYISLEATAAVPLLFLIYAWIRRSPNASEMLQNIWRRGKQLIMVTAFFQLCITSHPLWLPEAPAMTLIGWAKGAIYLAIIITTYLSQYMTDCFNDFPASDEDEMSS